jgi:hypothetical protein
MALLLMNVFAYKEAQDSETYAQSPISLPEIKNYCVLSSNMPLSVSKK